MIEQNNKHEQNNKIIFVFVKLLKRLFPTKYFLVAGHSKISYKKSIWEIIVGVNWTKRSSQLMQHLHIYYNKDFVRLK